MSPIYTPVPEGAEATPALFNDVFDQLETVITGPVDDLRIRRRNTGAVVSFSFDDATSYAYIQPWATLFAAQGVPATSYNNTANWVEADNASWLALQTAGWEIASHSANHTDLTVLTDAQLVTELEGSKTFFTSRGFTINNLAYPFGNNNALVRQVARRFYRSGRTVGTGLNSVLPLNTYALGAWNSDDEALATLQGYVDDAVAAGAWVHFYLHGHTSTRETKINSLIDYIQAAGVDIVTVNTALDRVGNTIEMGDEWAVGADGSVLKVSAKGNSTIAGTQSVTGIATHKSRTVLEKILHITGDDGPLGTLTPTTGQGIEIMGGATPIIRVLDRTADPDVYLPLNLNALSFSVSVSGTTKLSIAGDGNISAVNSITASALIPSGSGAPTNGMYLPAANTVGLATNSIERMRFNADGNGGVGNSDIEAWNSSFRALHLGTHNAVMWGNALSYVALLDNAYRDSVGYKRRTTGEAAEFYLNAGAFGFRVAASDAADTSISTWYTTLSMNQSGGAARIGFLGATAVAQGAAIVDADGTLADITTKFNTLKNKLKDYGLFAA